MFISAALLKAHVTPPLGFHVLDSKYGVNVDRVDTLAEDDNYNI